MPKGIGRIVSEKMLAVCAELGAGGLARGFYLAGGTGLALQIHHRRSVDLDFFTLAPTEKLPRQMVAREVERVFGQRIKTIRQEVDQATWEIAGVQVTFVAYPFPLLYDPISGHEISNALGALLLASVREIALMKAYALGRWATFRDFLDLYFVLKRNIMSLDDLIQDATRKFMLGGEPLFQGRLFLEQLIHPEDALDQDAALRLVDKSLTVREVSTFLNRAVRDFVARQVGEGQGTAPGGGAAP